MKCQRVEKSAIAEHAKNHGNEIRFDKVKMLNKEVYFRKRVYKEVTEIENVHETTTGKMDERLVKYGCQLYIRHKKKKIKRQETKDGNITTEEVTITTNENCRSKKGKAKCKKRQKQYPGKNNVNSK